ncbi:hypothetical protein [Xanthomonas translucens]|uniref:hypothetical protein n=1 Tax=Xanthomonas campestris pv. translucens TaxID=343 RepID=UPI00114C870F|nr:hypothetical protein [Xanthomonas translucens]MBC3973039.1 hypothetical protein [Xanthomonas translucens pv. undulosa]WLA17079.1 hypothetical protein MO326_06145 [Xanthomonas translucens]
MAPSHEDTDAADRPQEKRGGTPAKIRRNAQNIDTDCAQQHAMARRQRRRKGADQAQLQLKFSYITTI